jgi:hypothetical protein
LDPTALLVQKALLELKEARAEEDGR